MEKPDSRPRRIMRREWNPPCVDWKAASAGRPSMIRMNCQCDTEGMKNWRFWKSWWIYRPGWRNLQIRIMQGQRASFAGMENFTCNSQFAHAHSLRKSLSLRCSLAKCKEKSRPPRTIPACFRPYDHSRFLHVRDSTGGWSRNNACWKSLWYIQYWHIC